MSGATDFSAEEREAIQADGAAPDYAEAVRARVQAEQGDPPLVEVMQEAILSADALAGLDIPPRRKYLGPISEGTIGQIFGPRGIGKTQLRDAIALSITRGASLGPWEAGEPAGVLILDGEMSLHDLRARQNLSHNVGAALAPLDYLSSEYLFERGHAAINLRDAKWRDATLELIQRNPQWQVVILDNLSSFLPGAKENDSEAWGSFNQFLLNIRWMKRAAAFAHHAGKSGDQRGTSAREDQLDWVLKLDNMTGHTPELGCKFQAKLTKNRSLYGAEAEPFIFSLDGDPPKWTITSRRQSQKEIIIALFGHGVAQKDVCAMTGFDKGLISRTRTKAIHNDILTVAGDKFTAKGQYDYGDIDIDIYLES